MALALASGALWRPLPAAAEDLTLEYAVKANFLYKFGPFVEWPSRVPAGPFTVCVVGQDPFGSALNEAIRGQTVSGRAVAVRRMSKVSGRPPCHVLFIARSSQKPAEIFHHLAGAPVLTVTDQRLGTSGGMVHFVLRDGRVRFAVDEAGARASGLAISSKLLGLAVPLTEPGGR